MALSVLILHVTLQCLLFFQTGVHERAVDINNIVWILLLSIVCNMYQTLTKLQLTHSTYFST